jgi:hypothetical protein
MPENLVSYPGINQSKKENAGLDAIIGRITDSKSLMT